LENTIANSENIGTSVVEPMRHERPKNGFLEMVREITGKIGAVRFLDKITSFAFNYEDA
jgi:glutamate-1-semialdehyde aminotransferase